MTSVPSYTTGRSHVRALAEALAGFEAQIEEITAWGEELARRMLSGARLLTVGNGGSAAQAQHLSAEIVGRYCADRTAFSAVALHTEPSVLTAILNDYGGDEVFARQVAAHGRPGDVLVAMSTSGGSANVLAAARRARDAGIAVWSITGPAPTALGALSDRVLAIDAQETSTVQELTLVALHMVCGAFDDRVLAATDPPARDATAGDLPARDRTGRDLTARDLGAYPAAHHLGAADPAAVDPGPADRPASGADRGPRTSRPLVVLGDLLLDVDVTGTARRLSPEAPVPVISDPVENARPGGAGLAAVLSARSYDNVILIAPVADDEDARRLVALLPPAVHLIALEWTGSTSVKMRVRAGDHPVTRIDRGGRLGDIGPLPAAAVAALDQAGAVLVADYGLGLTSAEHIRAALAERAASTPIVWDPHPRGAEPVPGVRLATPNAAEAAAYTGAAADSGIAAVTDQAQALLRRWSAGGIAVTMGSAGALVTVGDGAPLVVPAPAVAASDTCGAGDAFAAAAAAALAGGALPSEAVTAAVAAAEEMPRNSRAYAISVLAMASGLGAGIAVAGLPLVRLGDSGWRVVAAGAFVAAGAAAAVNPFGGPPTDTAGGSVLEQVRARGGRVVATGGCFDLLHAGHVATLEAARELGDCLVVCLNSDASVRRLKGPSRPLQNEDDRALMLSALRCVDAVVVFGEETPEAVLRCVRPDVWVKGGDYLGATLPEAAVLAEWGGAVVTVPYLTGRSTTELVRRGNADTSR